MTRWSKVLTSQVDTAKVDEGWQRVRARRERPRVVRRAMVAAPLLVLAAVILLLASKWIATTTTTTTSFASPVAHSVSSAPLAIASQQQPLSQRIAIAGGTPLPAEWMATAPRVVHLDDGSRVELAANTRVAIGEGAPDHVDLSVESGRATFDVKPNGPRAWVIDAGEVVVRVLGTRFTVARSAKTVEVTVERGRVQVTAPEGTRILTAGQSFTSEREASASAAPTAVVPARAPLAPATSARAPDRMSRADSLRASGHPAEAVILLRDVVEGGDGRAALAAFTIGKIEAEDLRDPASGGRWFERAVGLGLPSGLDEEALARAVECWALAGSRVDAARVAKRYEARFPTGRHLGRVQEWARD